MLKKLGFGKSKGKAAEIDPALKDDPYVSEYVLPEWNLADKDKSGKLNKSEIRSLLRKLNVRLKDSEFDTKFKRVDEDGSGDLHFDEFKKFLEELREREELRELFNVYAKGKTHLTKDDLVSFLKKEQNDSSKNGVAEIISLFSFAQKDKLSFLGFCYYISSPTNSVYNPAHTKRKTVYQDMSQPLTHYFIASSHNTYLLGNQLQGEASTEAYKSSLLRGCRCVEVDCWDGDDGEPVVTHGHTMVKKVKFVDCMKTVKDFGFETSVYPIILSLENHCSAAQQVRMASILQEVFGSMLEPPFDNPKKPLPSPDALKNKVLIKGKKLKVVPDEASADTDEDDEEEEDDEDNKEKPKEKGSGEKKKEQKKKPAHAATAKELSDITHFNSTRFAGFEKDKDLFPWDMSSNSELRIKKFYKNEPDKLVVHNCSFLSRTYPKGTRFDSSNYNPMDSWSMGCQITALNYQTGDIPMFVNSGKFLDNGQSGYLIKPPLLLPTSGKGKGSAAATAFNITMKVISGWQLPKVSGTTKGDIIDPYIDVKVMGAEADYFHAKTKVINNNGYNPVWNETINFTVGRSDLAIILIQVWDEDKLSANDFVAYSSFPVTSLKTGYRSVQLYNSKFEELSDSSLLIHFNLSIDESKKPLTVSASRK